MILLLTLAPALTGFGQMTLSRFIVGEKAGAAARDEIRVDRPPDQEVFWTTNVFSSLQTNAANSASVGVASASAAANSIGWVGPFSIGATGSVSAVAFSTTNRFNSASASARAWFDIVFVLPFMHEYRLETFLEGTPSAPFNYISLEGADFLRMLPPDSGGATNTGRLAPGLYRLVADFDVSVNASEGATASSAAGYWLRLEIAPILPTLAIRRSGLDVVLSWTTNAAGFTLLRTTNVNSTNWQATSWPTVIVGDQFTVTEPVTDEQQFYRLVATP